MALEGQTRQAAALAVLVVEEVVPGGSARIEHLVVSLQAAAVAAEVMVGGMETVEMMGTMEKGKSRELNVVAAVSRHTVRMHGRTPAISQQDSVTLSSGLLETRSEMRLRPRRLTVTHPGTRRVPGRLRHSVLADFYMRDSRRDFQSMRRPELRRALHAHVSRISSVRD